MQELSSTKICRRKNFSECESKVHYSKISKFKNIEETHKNLEEVYDIIVESNSHVTQKIHHNTLHLTNSLKKFEVQFAEENSKIQSLNTDLWNEIKALHLKAELNGKSFVEYRERSINLESQFERYYYSRRTQILILNYSLFSNVTHIYNLATKKESIKLMNFGANSSNRANLTCSRLSLIET
jgi:hypothetical protein